MNVPVPNTNEAPNVDFKVHSYEQPQRVCPACGHCPCCGRGGHQFQPWPGYPQPYIGDPIYPWGGTTWTGVATAGQSSQTINSGWVYNQ